MIVERNLSLEGLGLEVVKVQGSLWVLGSRVRVRRSLNVQGLGLEVVKVLETVGAFIFLF